MNFRLARRSPAGRRLLNRFNNCRRDCHTGMTNCARKPGIGRPKSLIDLRFRRAPKISAHTKEPDFLAGREIVCARRQCPRPRRRHLFTIRHAGMTFPAAYIPRLQGNCLRAPTNPKCRRLPQLSSRKDNYRCATRFLTVSKMSLRKDNCRPGTSRPKAGDCLSGQTNLPLSSENPWTLTSFRRPDAVKP